MVTNRSCGAARRFNTFIIIHLPKKRVVYAFTITVNRSSGIQYIAFIRRSQYKLFSCKKSPVLCLKFYLSPCYKRTLYCFYKWTIVGIYLFSIADLFVLIDIVPRRHEVLIDLTATAAEFLKMS
jgi:hypothetical protein